MPARSRRKSPLLSTLLLGLFAACAATTDRTPIPGTGGTTGTGGGSGGSTGGSTGSGGGGGISSASGGSGGGVGSGGAPGSGGASGSGGATASGGSDGGEAVSVDAMMSTVPDGGATSSDGAAGGGSNDKHPLMPGNALVKCGAKDFHLPGASAEDFCAFYEMYCPYDPTGTMLNKGQTPAQRPDAKSTAPWYNKDYADCLARYNAASDNAKSCRAGQLCTNKAGGCTHGTGHFADCP